MYGTFSAAKERIVNVGQRVAAASKRKQTDFENGRMDSERRSSLLSEENFIVVSCLGIAFWLVSPFVLGSTWLYISIRNEDDISLC